MASFTRRIQRKRARLNRTWQPRETPYVYHPDGGYSVLTRNGWRHVSARRLQAQWRMAQLLGA